MKKKKKSPLHIPQNYPTKAEVLSTLSSEYERDLLWCQISAHDQHKSLKIPYDRAMNLKNWSNIFLQPAEKDILNMFQKIFSIFPRGRVAQAQHESEIQAVI